MPKGRSKGFGHYMCKKFFHPGNPENLERVFMAKERVKAKDKQEKEKIQEYEREQERWDNRAALTNKRDRDKLALSFMYDPPVGLKKEDKPDPDKKDEFKFEWQRNAPRQDYAKEDPNIVDHPFGINVQFTKCIRCQVWGHGHTDKHCPRYGKARDEEEPAQVINEKRLIEDMKEKDKLQFTSYGAWDNGKVGKHYDLVYSSLSEGEEGEHSDLMSGLLKEIRGKKRKIKVLRAKVKKVSSKECKSDRESKGSGARTSDKSRRRKRERKRSRARSESSRSDGSRKSKTEIISEQSRLEYLSKIDDILFSDIGPPKSAVNFSTKKLSSPSKRSSSEKLNNSHKSDDSSFLVEVEKILEGESAGSADTSTDAEEEEEVEDEDDNGDSSSSEEELNESENRLLNLINSGKIDVKLNFKEAYKDVNCHFCRTVEDTEHLAVCPVYNNIMRGTEFQDIRSKNVKKVKRGLSNIREALLKRSKALSVTSVGTVSISNMELLEPLVKTDLDEKSKKALEILNSQRFKIL